VSETVIAFGEMVRAEDESSQPGLETDEVADSHKVFVIRNTALESASCLVNDNVKRQTSVVGSEQNEEDKTTALVSDNRNV
jgi:hypothetical protein